jgi:hypothetical protein
MTGCSAPNEIIGLALVVGLLIGAVLGLAAKVK